MKISKSFALTLVVAVMASGSARAEFVNSFIPLPSSFPSGPDVGISFTMIFQGNLLSNINTTETQNDPLLNPYLYVNQHFFGGSGTTSVTATLDGSGNTDVTWTGLNPILPSYTFNYGSPPHFGLDGESGGVGAAIIPVGLPTLNLLSETWSNGVSTVAMPGVAASVAGAGVPGTDPYAIVFLQVTSGGNTVGQWLELPYTTPLPTITLTNNTSSAETLSDAGFYLSPTQIPLDQLNYSDNPPPGLPGSPFAPLPGLDGDTLPANGGSVTLQNLPEPSSIISMAMGLLVVAAGSLGCRRMARRAGA